MARRPGTRCDGRSFGPAEIEAVWQKAEPLITFPGYRRDVYGTPMRRLDYGDNGARCGWEIDHIKPVAHGGTDDLDNLQALHWENNRTKGDHWSGSAVR